MTLVVAFAATAVCLAAATSPAVKMPCASMDDAGDLATLGSDCCAVDPPNSYGSIASSLTGTVLTPLVVVTQLASVEPRVQPQFSPMHSRDRGPRHDSASRSHVFDAVFRI